MNGDMFGNLMEWSRVMDQLDLLQTAELLEDQQPGLARILRYRRNWRLCRRVLQMVCRIRRPADVLIAELLNVLVDTEMDHESRILAARALGGLLPLRPPREETQVEYDPQRVVTTMSDMCRQPGPPVVMEAVHNALARIQRPRTNTTPGCSHTIPGGPDQDPGNVSS